MFIVRDTCASPTKSQTPAVKKNFDIIINKVTQVTDEWLRFTKLMNLYFY